MDALPRSYDSPGKVGKSSARRKDQVFTRPWKNKLKKSRKFEVLNKWAGDTESGQGSAKQGRINLVFGLKSKTPLIHQFFDSPYPRTSEKNGAWLEVKIGGSRRRMGAMA